MEEKPRKTKIKIIDRVASERKLGSRFEQKMSRNVRFADVMVDNTDSRKKHHSASILKKKGNSLEVSIVSYSE